MKKTDKPVFFLWLTWLTDVLDSFALSGSHNWQKRSIKEITAPKYWTEPV